MEGIFKDQAAPNCRVTADERCQFIERFEGLDTVNTSRWNNGKSHGCGSGTSLLLPLENCFVCSNQSLRRIQVV